MLISSSSPVVFTDDEYLAKHLTGRHDQGSHAGGLKGYPQVKDKAAKASRDPKAVEAAIALRTEARKADALITPKMGEIAAATGGQFEYLQERIKSTDSLARKIKADADDKYKGNIDKAAEDISDVNRYTLTYDDKDYVGAAEKTITELEKAGYEVRAKNFWQEGDDYQGINIKMTSPEGQKIELQLHTKDSFQTKETKSHDVYVKFREESDGDTKLQLWNEMVAIAAEIPLPTGYDKLLTLGKLEKHEYKP